MTSDTPEKKRVIEKLLEADFMLVHINTQFENLSLPPYLKQNPNVTLKLSHYFARPLILKDSEIIADLRFNGEYQRCIIPYEAIWGASNTENELVDLWPESTPKGFSIDAVKTPAKPALAAIDGSNTLKEEKKDSPIKSKINHLRRVK